MSKEITIEYVRSEFEKEGYTLLSKRYINNRQKLNYICDKGHKSSIIWNSWQQGRRCRKCWNIRFGDSNRGII